MKKNAALSKTQQVWKTALVVAAIALTLFVPMLLGNKTEAQTANTVTTLVATLTGSPIGGMVPIGVSVSATDGTNRAFETNVSFVNLPAQTDLTVVVNGATAGHIILTALKNGELDLTGTAAPTVATGATISVKNGTTTILTGTFTAPPTPTPTPTRSPTPTVSPTPTRSPTPTPSPTATPTPRPTPSLALFAPLTGAVISGAMPVGFGDYFEFGTASKTISVFVNRVRLPNGTVLTVKKGNAMLGQIALREDGEGSLRLDSAQGGTVPTVAVGDMLTVMNGTTTILSGTFRTVLPLPSPTPTRSPTPSPSPTVSPTPRPTPGPNRVFGGRMSGAQVVPAVTTAGRGFIGVLVNDTGTQIRVAGGFFGLSSTATTAKIYGPSEVGSIGPVIFDLGTVAGTAGAIGPKTFDITTGQLAQLRAGTWYVQIATSGKPSGEIRGQIRSHADHSSFNGAESTDLAVFRQSTGTWFVQNGEGYSVKLLGQPGDKPVSGDYDGDGVTDVAVYRGGIWVIQRSSDGGTTTAQFGLPSDIPVRGDFDGDGQNDLTVFRPENGVWYSWLSSTGSFKYVQFGLNDDIPVSADIDGDGTTDNVVFRPSNGVWYRLGSLNGQFSAIQFGMQGDVPLTGDYDGDGVDDVAIYRPNGGEWYVTKSSDGGYFAMRFGTGTDVPVSGDFDGDGKTDVTVFRPETGVWYVFNSSNQTVDYRYFGLMGDVPTSVR